MRRGFWLGLSAILLAGSSCRQKKQQNGASDHPAGNNITVAKLLVRPGSKAAQELKNRNFEDFYEAQRSALENPETQKIASEKAGAFLGEPPPAIALRVARVKGSEVMNIIVRCSSADYAKSYVTALIEAYIVKVQGIQLENEDKQVEGGKSAELIAAEKKLDDTEKALRLFKLEHDGAQLISEIEAGRKRLKRLASTQSFYVSELDFLSRSTLDADVARRKFPPTPPLDIPEEFARVLGLQLTPNEEAYLNALTKADSAAVAATKPRAEKDHAARIESHRHQLAAVRELIKDGEKQLLEMDALASEAKKMEDAFAKARASYEKLHSAENASSVEALSNNTGPQVVIIVIQKPDLVNAAP
jgi:hypothetical protein